MWLREKLRKEFVVACELGGTIIAGLFLLFTGCGGKGEEVKIPEIGFSMRLPSGWVNERETRNRTDYKQFYEIGKRDYCWGDISVGQLESYDIFTGETKKVNTITEYVDDILKDQEKMNALFGKMAKALGKIVGGEEGGKRMEEEFEGAFQSPLSKTQRRISGFEAIELVFSNLVNIYISKDDKVIIVTFRTPAEEFSKYEASFRKSIESIKIR